MTMRKPSIVSFFQRSKLAREIALMFLVKLFLVFTIKFLFFSNPVPKNELVERIQANFGSEQSSSER